MPSDQPSVGYDLDGLSAADRKLSEREIEILRHVATGATNKEIARQLFISPNTVKVHIRNIFAKLEVATRTEAAFHAAQIGLVEGITKEPSVSGLPGAGRSSKGALRGWPNAWVLGALALLLMGLAAWSYALIRSPAQVVTIPNDFPSNQQPRWRVLSSMPTSRSSFAVTAYENAVYAIAGETGNGVTGAMERYDPISDTWTSLPPKPTAVSEVQAVVVGGEVFVPGGRISPNVLTSVLEVYDAQEERWEQRAPLPQALSAYALATFEGRIFLFGGWDGTSFVASVYEYDRENDAWKELAPMQLARGFAGAATAGGRIHIIGGYDGQQVLSIHESFSPTESTNDEMPWNQHAPLPDGRYAMGTASVADIIHVIGGEGNGNQVLSPLKYFLPTNSWQAFEAPLTGSRWVRMGLVPLQTHLYAYGGELENETSAQLLNYEAVYTVAIPLLP